MERSANLMVACALGACLIAIGCNESGTSSTGETTAALASEGDGGAGSAGNAGDVTAAATADGGADGGVMQQHACDHTGGGHGSPNRGDNGHDGDGTQPAPTAANANN
jgi:hypothetical protein